MTNIESIQTDAEYEKALERIDSLMAASPETAAAHELSQLLDLVDEYQREHQPIEYPDPITAIEFRMEQANLQPSDLIPHLGSSDDAVSKVLSGAQPITPPMARALNEHLGIPLQVFAHSTQDAPNHTSPKPDSPTIDPAPPDAIERLCSFVDSVFYRPSEVALAASTANRRSSSRMTAFVSFRDRQAPSRLYHFLQDGETGDIFVKGDIDSDWRYLKIGDRCYALHMTTEGKDTRRCADMTPRFLRIAVDNGDVIAFRTQPVP